MWDEIKNSVLHLCIRFEASHLGHISMGLSGRQLDICLVWKRDLGYRNTNEVVKEVHGT